MLMPIFSLSLSITILLLSWCTQIVNSGSRFQVRVWQPAMDTSKIKEPVRFWELVEWRPMESQEENTTEATTTSTTTTTTTTRTTTTTTTPPPTTTTTVEWEPPTTVEMCDETDPEKLMKRMKDSGIYNEIYMATDFMTASKTFPNLGGRQFMKPKNKYQCDEHCERSSRLVRLVMTGDEASRVPVDPPRTWWDPSKWEQPERMKRSILDVDEKLSRRRQLELSIKSAMEELETLDEPEQTNGGPAHQSTVTPQKEQEEPEPPVNTEPSGDSYEEFFASDLSSGSRKRRSVPTGLVQLLNSNSGTSKDVLGTTIALECQERNSGNSKAGYQFCLTCRAVRHLPRTYFPRIINEVICAETKCIKGDGRCAQRFLPFKVLHNEGTENCPKWRLVTIDIRTCCDCVLHPYSPFVRYLQN